MIEGESEQQTEGEGLYASTYPGREQTCTMVIYCAHSIVLRLGFSSCKIKDKIMLVSSNNSKLYNCHPLLVFQ